MSTPVDPVLLLQMGGESWAQWQARLQQLNPPTSGPNQAIASQWLGAFATPGVPAPSSFQIK